MLLEVEDGFGIEKVEGFGTDPSRHAEEREIDLIDGGKMGLGSEKGDQTFVMGAASATDVPIKTRHWRPLMVVWLSDARRGNQKREASVRTEFVPIDEDQVAVNVQTSLDSKAQDSLCGVQLDAVHTVGKGIFCSIGC